MKLLQFFLFGIAGLWFELSNLHGQGYVPELAIEKMTVAKGLQVKLFASEPEVRQPSFVKCDDQGRLWTIQYLQYPNPAGLKRVKVDRWSRTIYDRVPQPPPHGPRGADKITILEDTNGDGHADKVKDFVDGLNLVTGVAFGHGGVFVLNVPYLLFYPDRNHDDVPDSDPEVLLTGFGMEDAQSMSNHLTWGPDGWLYGVNGSTTTCRIRGIEFQQGLWRYHPLSKKFELFCEGGSNCYGVTFNENGEVFYSTNGGPFVHGVQGGYFFKSFGKHGPLHNLYAYHYFANLECDLVPGGPPTGGTIYVGDSFPKQFRGKFIAGNFLGHTASWWWVEPTGSTVKAQFGATILDSHDTWFGPTDMCLSPDGSMYVCDFHDQRTAHPDPDANWDKENGRIYKIEAVNLQAKPHIDVRKLSSNVLVNLLSSSNGWYVNRARCELAARRDKSVLPRLRAMATQTDNPQLALKGVWAHHVTAGIDDALAIELLTHPFEYVRFWAVRLLGDERKVSQEIATKLGELAQHESSVVVRTQLAATAKRLSGSAALAIIKQLLTSNPNETDERATWLLWWAIEAHAISDLDRVVAMFQSPESWQNPASRENGLRLIRRYAAEGRAIGYEACLVLLNAVPKGFRTAANDHLLLGLSERAVGLSTVGQGGLFEQEAQSDQGANIKDSREFDSVSKALSEYIKVQWQMNRSDLGLLELALLSKSLTAHQHLLALVQESENHELQSKAIQLLEKYGQEDAVGVLLQVFSEAETGELKSATLGALAKWEAVEVTQAVLAAYQQSTPAVQSQIRSLLFSRPSSALKFFEYFEAEGLEATTVPINQLRRLAIHKNKSIDALVRQHWGNVGPGTPEEKLATMRRFSNDLRAAVGDPTRGKILFTKHCGVCHQLHGEGIKIGPDLTTANRTDQTAMLGNIVDPSAIIRREYINYIIETSSGRLLTGLLAEQDAASVTILDAQNKRTKIARDDIEELREAEISLMPEKILEGLTPQELRDLFSYLVRP